VAELALPPLRLSSGEVVAVRVNRSQVSGRKSAMKLYKKIKSSLPEPHVKMSKHNTLSLNIAVFFSENLQ
jgi:hypothetical protein